MKQTGMQLLNCLLLLLVCTGCVLTDRSALEQGKNQKKLYAASAMEAPFQYSQKSEEIYDIVIRGGRVLDGSGSPWVNADIGISDGRIVKMGPGLSRGRKEIDASGYYVSPGWIDMMDQSNETLLQDGLAESKVRMGVTTLIAGEGGTPVPAEEIGDYFDRLESQGISVNFGSYYATMQARIDVIGDNSRSPTAEEIQAMRERVRTAMTAGALGVSTALIYPPSSYQSTEEIVSLAEVASQYGGMYASHIRGEGRELLSAVQEAIEIGETADLPVEIFHLKSAYAPEWGKAMKRVGVLIEDARSRGVDVAADVYPYTAGSSGLEITVPPWVFADGVDTGMRRLADPAIRERIKKEIATDSEGKWFNVVEATNGWDGVILLNAFNKQYDAYRFQSIQSIAKRMGKDPADIAWDIMLAALPDRAEALYFMMDEGDIETALRFPWTSIGSDSESFSINLDSKDASVPHPRAFGTFPRIISRYVRSKEVLTLPEAIRKMTAWPAARMGLFDRGILREGMWADVVIFDFQKIADTATYMSPMQYPVGIEYVIVNGQIVVEKEHHTRATPGLVLRGPGYNESQERD